MNAPQTSTPTHIDNLTRAEAQERATIITNVAYDVSVVLSGDPAAETFVSTTVATFDATTPGVATFIDINAATVERIELNGQSLPLELFNGFRVALPTTNTHNTLTITANCRYQHTGVGLHRRVDPVDQQIYMYTHFEPFDAHKVFACFDQPDIKAPFTLHVSAPQAWEIISNNPVATQQDDGDQRHTTFTPTPPLPTYLTAFITGPFHVVRDVHNGIPLGIYCRTSLAQYLDPEEIFEITKQGLDFHTAYFDYPYPFAKYDQVMVPEFNASAMENPGCITFNEMHIFRSKVTNTARSNRATTILHEMAHMWFGDLVTMRWWDDLWLNESFATYMSALSQSTATRFTDAWVYFANRIKSWSARQDQLPSTHPIAADMVDTESVGLNFDGITYGKGASVLRQLVAWVGDEPFRQGLRGYFRQYEWSNATLSDFLAALESGSGRELTSWSKEWLETTGIATLSPHFTESDGVFTSLEIVQTPHVDHPTVRSHRIALGLYNLQGEQLVRTRRIECDITGERTTIPEIVGETVPDLLLINDEDLTFAKVRFDTRSVTTMVTSLGQMADPLARAVCWTAAWDMTRDAEMTTSQYVAMVAHHAHVEEVSVLERLMAQAIVAIDTHAVEENRLNLRSLLARAAHTELQHAEPGSDTQLAWVRGLVAVADVADDIALLRGLLDGSRTIPGLAVDTDLRWQIVTRLAATGVADDAAIDAEFNRDPTDFGQRNAATARAAMPTMAAKEAAWQRLLGEKDLPLATLEAITKGFFQPDQGSLLAGYTSRFVDELPGIWAGRTTDEAVALTEGLYPRYASDDSVIAAADRALADTSLPGPARRILMEEKDGTLRAQRARKRDAAR